jgi:hypothetical protein
MCRTGAIVQRSGSFSGVGSQDDVIRGRIIVASAASLPKVWFCGAHTCCILMLHATWAQRFQSSI